MSLIVSFMPSRGDVDIIVELEGVTPVPDMRLYNFRFSKCEIIGDHDMVMEEHYDVVTTEKNTHF